MIEGRFSHDGGSTARFVSDLVENSEDRFSHDTAHMQYLPFAKGDPYILPVLPTKLFFKQRSEAIIYTVHMKRFWIFYCFIGFVLLTAPFSDFLFNANASKDDLMKIFEH